RPGRNGRDRRAAPDRRARRDRHAGRGRLNSRAAAAARWNARMTSTYVPVRRFGGSTLPVT
ncbi:hypothetical protein, partial [Streptomyces sp. NPDC005407]|uniref:hypothetical protein n=1 Tax=Streptomyces sp. NPDC005407 TaxID=3155340 RepID=UPI00339FEAEF